MSTWTYFVSYAHGVGGMGFGNFVVTRDAKIESIDGITTLSREVEKNTSSLITVARNVVVIGITLLDYDPNGEL